MASPPGSSPGSTYYAATAPAPIPQMPPPGAVAPWYERGPSLYELVQKIRGGLQLYVVALLLQFVAAIVSAAVVGYTSAGLFGGSLDAAKAEGVASGAVGLGLLSGLAVFVAFILIIIAWLRWRDGIRPLPQAAMASGQLYALAAQEAVKNYSRTFWMFILQILSAIGFAIVLVAVIIGSVAGCIGQNSTTNSSGCATHVTGIIGNIVGVTVGYAVVVFVLTLLMYYFATTSLVGALRAIASPAEQTRLDRGRLFAILGVVLSPLGLLNLALVDGNINVPAIAFVGLISPLLLLYGFYELHGAYSSWTASKVDRGPPPTTPGAPGPYNPYGGFPPVAMPYPGAQPPPYAPPAPAPYAPPPPR